jgi:hypothetical protein
MTIHWDSLLAVLAVSLGSTVAIVVLVTLALLGCRPGPAARCGIHGPPAAGNLTRDGTAVAAVCPAAAAPTVLLVLWALIAR